MDLVDKLQSLKSAWGLLSVATVLFPGAAYWFNISSIKSSPIGEYYLLVGVPLGALTLIFALILADNISDTSSRNIALILSLVVLPGAIAGLVLKSADCKDASPVWGPTTCSAEMFGYQVGNGYVTSATKRAGRITEVRSFCECYPTGGGEYNNCKYGQWQTVRDEINPSEYYAVALFSTCIVTLTMIFTLLASLFD
jgi:hypothetical protein